MGTTISQAVGDLSTRPPVTVRGDDTLRQVAHTLWLESIGLVVVGDVTHPLGVVSERDLVTALALGADPDSTTAADVMTKPLVTARAYDHVLDALLDMMDHDIRHLLVVDDVGVRQVISIRDLLRPMVVEAVAPFAPPGR